MSLGEGRYVSGHGLRSISYHQGMRLGQSRRFSRGRKSRILYRKKLVLNQRRRIRSQGIGGISHNQGVSLRQGRRLGDAGKGRVRYRK